MSLTRLSIFIDVNGSATITSTANLFSVSGSNFEGFHVCAGLDRAV